MFKSIAVDAHTRRDNGFDDLVEEQTPGGLNRDAITFLRNNKV